MTQDISVIILSAGKGTRMKSDLPKVMHKIAGREMINMVIDEAKKLDPQNITIVISEEMLKFKNHIIKEHPSANISFVNQEQRLGTGHAVSCAIKSFDQNKKLAEKILILYGDTPLISSTTINKMLSKIDITSNFNLCILSFENKQENSYGKLLIKNDKVLKIIENKDATPQERKIEICNSGVIAIKSKNFTTLLSQIKNNNVAQEFYLTDLVEISNKENLDCCHILTNGNEVLGANSRLELAQIEKIKQKQIRQKMMENGVTLISPKNIQFNYDTEISNDVIIHPFVVFGKGVKIDNSVEIKSFSHIEGATIKSGAVIGPFARIRPDTTIHENVHIGNFVEIKKSDIGTASKINHLSYIGDTKIGSNSNIGAGSITCNYDGFNKYETTIGNNVFVGSNTAIVAPTIIEDDSIIGAGSVITKKVNKGDLAISRAKQSNIENGAIKFRNSRGTPKKPNQDEK